MNLGVKIKELRKTQQLSQDGFAEKFNVTRQTVSNWETGKSYPDLEIIVAISDEFAVSLDELLKGDTAVISQIDGEKKKKKMLALTLVSLVFVFAIFSFSVYRYIQVTNKVTFSMNNAETRQLKDETGGEVTITHGYFSVPRSGKIQVKTQGAVDSGSLAINIINHQGKAVYQLAGDHITDIQTLQLEKGSYDIQITANDYTESIISLSYDVAVRSQ